MMTKEELINAITEYINIKKAMLTFDKKTHHLFCIIDRVDEIHISTVSPISFNEMTAILQATVICNPNFTKENGEKYFYLTINGEQIKVFALWEKQH